MRRRGRREGGKGERGLVGGEGNGLTYMSPSTHGNTMLSSHRLHKRLQFLVIHPLHPFFSLIPNQYITSPSFFPIFFPIISKLEVSCESYDSVLGILTKARIVLTRGRRDLIGNRTVFYIKIKTCLCSCLIFRKKGIEVRGRHPGLGGGGWGNHGGREG